MGHVTADRIKDAWKKLNAAEKLIDADKRSDDPPQTYAAVQNCETALRDLYKSADGMGKGTWFVGIEGPVRDDINEAKRGIPEKDEARELVAKTREVVRKTRDEVIPVLNDRIDYEVTVSLDGK